MSAPTPTWDDGLMLELNHPSLSWLYMDIPVVIEMAHLHPDESGLMLNCETEDLAIEVLRAGGASPRRIVGIGSGHGALQQAVIMLENFNPNHDVKLFHGDIYNLQSVTRLHEVRQVNHQTGFDVVFARNALPPDPSQHDSILRHWATLLTPVTGRMVVAYTPCDQDNTYLSGFQVVDESGNIVTRGGFLLESDWVRIEENFRALAGQAGLQVKEMQRLYRRGEDVMEMGDVMETGMRRAFTEPGWKEQSSVNADGTPTLAYKQHFL